MQITENAVNMLHLQLQFYWDCIGRGEMCIVNVFWQFTIPKPQPFYQCDSFVVYRQQDIKNINRYIYIHMLCTYRDISILLTSCKREDFISVLCFDHYIRLPLYPSSFSPHEVILCYAVLLLLLLLLMPFQVL